MDIDFGLLGTYNLLMPVNIPGTSVWGTIPSLDLTHFKKVSLKDFLANTSIRVDLVCENWQPKLKVKIGSVTKAVDIL